jgi:hypothetical protein
MRRWLLALFLLPLTGHAATSPPTFSLAAGTYTMPQSTTLVCTGTGCTITWCFHSGSTSCTPGTSYSSSIYLCPASPSACPTTGQATTICAFATVSGVNSTTPCNTYTTGNPNLATGDGRGVQMEPSMPLTTSCTTVAATLYLVKTTTLNVDPLNATISTPKKMGGSGGTSLEPSTCTGVYSSTANTCSTGFNNVETNDTRVQAAINGLTSGGCVELTLGASGQNAFVLAPWHPISNVVVVADAGVTVNASRNPADYGGGSCGTVSSSGDTSCGSHWIAPSGVSNAGVMGYGVFNARCWDRAWNGSSNNAVTSGFCYNRVITYCRNHSNAWAGITCTGSTNNGHVAYGPDSFHWKGSTNTQFYKFNLVDCGNFCIYWGDNAAGLTAWGINVLAAAEVSNSDGFDPSYKASNVTLARSNISVGDNDVAVKSDCGSSCQGYTSGVTQNLSFLNDNFGAGIGTNMGWDSSGGITNVLFSGLAHHGSNNNPTQQYAHGMQSLSSNNEGGTVSTVTYQNTCIDNESKALYYSYNSGQLVGGNEINTTILNGGEVEFEGISGSPFTLGLNNVQATGSGSISGSYKYGTINLGPNNVTSNITSRLSGTGLTVNNNITNPGASPFTCTSTTATTLGSWLPLWGNMSMSYGGNHNLQGLSSTLSSVTFTLQAVLMPATAINVSESQALTQPIQFYDNGTAIGSPVTLGSNGTLAKLNWTATTGVHNFTAKYPGDSNYPSYTFGSNPFPGSVLTVNVTGGALPAPPGFGVFISGP